MTNLKNTLFLLLALSIVSCSDDDDTNPSINAPETYSFERDGSSTVAFDGQTTRILMGEELNDNMLNFSVTAAELQELFANQDANGNDVDPYTLPELNVSTKSIRSKVAASTDYFSTNTAESAAIKSEFDEWIEKQVSLIFPGQNNIAEPGIAGQLPDATATRYVDGDGIEYNELVIKGIISALMVDQIANNYLSASVLDAGDNRANNDAGIIEDGKTYTTMEHKWDEAYGYIYGTAADLVDPNPTIGADDSFLNKYVGRAEGDDDFAGIADEIYDALKLGRAAIVAGDYDLRDEQADIVRQKLSEIIGIRAVFYLEQGAIGLGNSPVEYGTVFHDLSEGLAFIYGLQFTHNPDTDAPYFSRAEVMEYFNQIWYNNTNGLWTVTPEILETISDEIASRFDFTVEQAGS